MAPQWGEGKPTMAGASTRSPVSSKRRGSDMFPCVGTTRDTAPARRTGASDHLAQEPTTNR